MIERVKYIVNILIVVLLFTAVSIQKDGYFWGNDVVESLERVTSPDSEAEVIIERSLDDGTRVINTSSLGRDIIGFAGRTPLEVYVKDGRIVGVEYLENSETPDFWDMVVQADLAERWNGLELSEAATAEIDGVSGATYSAIAVIGNVRRAAEYGSESESISTSRIAMDWRDIAGLLVILLGVVSALVRSRNKVLHLVQMALNVVVLGFWCGSFLSLTTFVSWAANGVNLSMSLTTIGLGVVAVVLPLFNRRGTYCSHHCPMGSAQELLGKLPVTKLGISPGVGKWLGRLRYYIFILLMFIMWCGVGFDVMNYEIFSAFIWGSASTVVLVLAGVFLTLSVFVTRPYCRYVCPTGAVITLSQTRIK